MERQRTKKTALEGPLPQPPPAPLAAMDQGAKGNSRPFLLFLLFYLLYVAFTWRDYSVTWDEADSMNHGGQVYHYFTHGMEGGEKITNPLFRDHTYIYAVLLMFLAGGSDLPQDVYHLLSMLCALAAYWGAYWLFKKETGSPVWALAGPAALFLTPLLVGHVPANFMDAPNAGFFLLSLIAIYWAAPLDQLALKRILVLGAFFGIAAALRLSSLTLFPTLFLFDLLDRRKEQGWRGWLFKEGTSLFLTLVVSQFVMAFLWPYIAQDYFHRLADVFHATSNLAWAGTTMYFGVDIPCIPLPWHYLPVWICITIPGVFVVFAFLTLHPRFRRKGDRWVYVTAAALAVNFLAWILVRPVIHSGIRHMLYLLPVVSLLGARALVDFWRAHLANPRPSLASKVALDLSKLSLAFALFTLAAIHPYQYLYYNELAGGFPGGMRRFEGDYWVQSNKEALEWIRKDLERRGLEGKVGVKFVGHGWPEQLAMGTRLMPVMDGSWDYRIVNSRLGQGLTPVEEPLVVHVVKRLGVPLCWVVYKGPGGKGEPPAPGGQIMGEKPVPAGVEGEVPGNPAT